MIGQELLAGLLIPFLGTSLGAACVFVMKKEQTIMMAVLPQSCPAFFMRAGARCCSARFCAALDIS